MDNHNLIGRQPILNRMEEIVAYELLFRSPRSVSSAAIDDATRASAIVMVNALTGIGGDRILSGQHGYINVEADLLMDECIELLPPEQFGFEILENTPVTQELIERCRQLKARGWRLALDDHEYREVYIPLYDGLVDLVKLDLLKTPLDGLYETVNRLKRYPVTLLAEKVDSRAAYLRSRGMGFELFQGYFFARPSLIQKRRLEDSVSILFELMSKLGDDACIDEVEAVFKKSPALTYKLLLLVNSVSTGLREKIRTVRHAITIIGFGPLRKWVQLAVFAADDSRGFSNPVVDMAAVRATLMENLAGLPENLRCFKCAPDRAFMVGILSVLNDFYGIPMEDVVSGLNLSDDIITALVSREGRLGGLLHLVELLEQNELDAAALKIEELGLLTAGVNACQTRAFGWRQTMEAVA